MLSPAPPFDRAIALACTLRTLRGRWFYVRCACRTSSWHPVRLMLQDDPATACSIFADVLVRLRCGTSRPPRVGALDRDTAAAGRGR